MHIIYYKCINCIIILEIFISIIYFISLFPIFHWSCPRGIDNLTSISHPCLQYPVPLIIGIPLSASHELPDLISYATFKMQSAPHLSLNLCFFFITWSLISELTPRDFIQSLTCSINFPVNIAPTTPTPRAVQAVTTNSTLIPIVAAAAALLPFVLYYIFLLLAFFNIF